MASESLACVLRHIHHLAETPVERQRSDAELLHCFLVQRDETAFRHLVLRHSRMVLSVCRHVLRQQEDAEDAFQATFLILARNAASIRKQGSLASWLHGVAYRTSLKARAEMSKRRRREQQTAKAGVVQAERELALRELQAVLSEEVARLSEKYRAPFVLCCLEGMSRSEAAQQLGWKEGTVSGRLAEARKRLQARLERRGFTLSAVLCAAAVGAGAEAAAPPLLLRTTIVAALGIAAGQSTKGVVSAPVAVLVDGATRALLLSKVKLAGLVFTAVGIVAAAAGSQFHRVVAVSAESEPAALPAASAADKPLAQKPAKTAKKDSDIVVQGRVLDPDGKPLAGAQLFFLPTGDRIDSPKDPRSEVAKSGGDGRFRFVEDLSHLVHGRWLAAIAEGYALDWIDADKIGTGEITLRLAKDIPITGRILTLEGRPVKGAFIYVKEVAAPAYGGFDPVLHSIQRDGNRVFAHPMRDCSVGTGSRFLAPVKTDEQGRFRFTGLGRERVVRLWVEGPDIEHNVLYVLTRREVNVKELVKEAPNRRGILSPLPAIYGPSFEHLAGPTKPVTGIVRDQTTGKPVADVEINGTIPGGWWENQVFVKTDKDGRYRLFGLPKAPSYRITAWGGPQKNYLLIRKEVSDSEGLTPIALDFELVCGIRVHGRITDKATGKPVPANLLYVPREKNKHFADLSQNDLLNLTARLAGAGRRNDKHGAYSFLAWPGPGIILVQAKVEDNWPHPHFGFNRYTQALLDPADRDKAIPSNPEEGDRAIIRGVGGSGWPLSLHNAYRVIDPAPNVSSLTCDFALDPGRTRLVKILDPEGKALNGVSVTGINDMGGGMALSWNSFKAIALNPARPRTIVFTHKERKLLGYIRLGGEEKEPVTVRLQPGAVLKGRAIDENDKPLSGVVVRVKYRLRDVLYPAETVLGNPPTQTDANGRFCIECIFPDLEFGLDLRKGSDILSIDEKYRELKLSAGTKDLGDIRAKRAE